MKTKLKKDYEKWVPQFKDVISDGLYKNYIIEQKNKDFRCSLCNEIIVKYRDFEVTNIEEVVYYIAAKNTLAYTHFSSLHPAAITLTTLNY